MALNFDNNQELERLFLLELLVDNVQLNYSKIDLRRSFLCTLQKTCVRFYFRDYPPVEVGEEDFCPMTNINGNQHMSFKSGKACLFSLQDIPSEMEYFEIGAEVYRQPENLPKVLLARACIDLGDMFKNIVNDVRGSCQSGPVTRAAKNTYSLVGSNGVDVGSITLFVRVSCFGKRIVGSRKDPCTDLGGIGDRGRLSDSNVGKSQPMVPGGDSTFPSSGVLGYAPDPMSQTGFPGGSAMGPQNYGGFGSNSATNVGSPVMMGMAQGSGSLGVPMNFGMAPGTPGMMSYGIMGAGMPYSMPSMGASMSGINRIPSTPYSHATLTKIQPEGVEQVESPGEKRDEETEDPDKDKDKDVLKLEIGNKNKVGKKPKIEIVLKTPKLKFDEVKLEERETQYLESDIVPPKPAPARKQSKKGKKGKKGKKK